MSENIPSTSKHTSSCANQPPRKTRRKYEKLKLPTPPPDPTENKKETCTENEFLEYLEHLQKHTSNYSRSTSTLASALIAEDAFDHLEKLYKLMEQMLELRAQNAKLHRKIRDLEHLNNLEKMYKEVEKLAEEETCPELERDTAFAETILESILYEPKQTLKSKGSLRQSLMRKHRNRSSSATDKPVGLDISEAIDQRRASLSVATIKKPSSKVSKWTKVKAAFKWEKASTTVGDAKSLDSGISGIAPMEIARYLRVPSHDDTGHSPSDSGAAEISTPGSLSSASSNENFRKSDHHSPYEEGRSSDDDISHVYSSHSKEDPNISPRSSQRSPRTTWARMKNIINTKNPTRKKSRMSTHSDDIQIDIELCSDNEEVFEDNTKSHTISNSNATSCGKLDSENDIPLDIRERYKINDDNLTDSEHPEYRKISKWVKVKKAFLPNSEATEDNSEIRDTIGKYGKDCIQSEINRNYRNLQKKLSIEFQEKLSEWKRIKQNSPSISNTTPSCSNTEDQMTTNPTFMKKIEEWEKIKSQPPKPKCNIQMTNEENLPPEFKKKLQEWEKIKRSSMRKSTKKIGDIPRYKSRTIESSPIEIPVISEEFKKKLEEWKQIKAGCYDGDKKEGGDNTPSPTLHHKEPKIVKNSQDKELQWYEKELNKIEKEKGRLERERQKFMEKEERLSKLRKAVTGGHKKDILVHTPSGFYKFEGISRKFTQKLYEWEKSRGIGPESSTFAFLTPDCPSSPIPKVKINGKDHTPPLTRSRSVDSVVLSAITIGCPLISQPSSLSLNDVDDLEMKCLVDSKSSSTEYLPNQCNEIDTDEPEALIVEVEDFVEETAAPLKSFVEQHNPVYQREENKALCVCLSPKIQRSESTRAQTNYTLIEKIMTSLRDISENEVEIRKLQIEGVNEPSRFEDLRVQQKNLVNELNEKLQKLQEENSSVVLKLTKENQNKQSSLIDILDVVQDLSIEILAMAEKLGDRMENREMEKHELFNELPAQEIIEEIKNKLLELRRHLSYVCAASDTAAPMKNKLCRMKSVICEKSSNESHCTISDLSVGSDLSEQHKPFHYIKAETKPSQSQGAIKKRLRYRVENIRRKSLQDSDEEDDQSNDSKKILCPKFLRSRNVSEVYENVHNKNTYNFPVVSKTTFQEPSRVSCPDSPVTIFVKTTRKLFTPLVESTLIKEPDTDEAKEHVEVNTSDEINVKTENDDVDSEHEHNSKVQKSNLTGLPPLPVSPTPQKKIAKEISPSIRMMLTKYHQKISEQDSVNKSGGSSGSASPVAWRSPTSERRVKAQTEKYQEEIIKLSPLPHRREVQKCHSQGHIQTSVSKQYSLPETEITSKSGVEPNRKKSILKSCSAANLTRKILMEDDHHEKLDEQSSKFNSQLRLQKLKKAKEEFLNSGPSSAPPLDVNCEEILEYPTRNRLSQISVASSSSAGSVSPGLLVKSVSAGMIHIAAEAYRQFESKKQREYVSLPRNSKPNITKKSALSCLAAKFRKVKMRRGKEKGQEKFPAVSELCRQSLVVDLNVNNSTNVPPNSDSASGVNSAREVQQPSISKSSSWIKKAKFFKK